MQKLDKIDIAILDTLQRNGRLTRKMLSEQVGLSQSPCHSRVKRLEKEKYISFYAAKIDINRALKVSVAYVTITLERHRTADFDIFERSVKKYDEIVECHALGGGVDYLLKVVVSNISDYQQFIDNLLSGEIGIAQYFTHFVTKNVKEFKGYPLKKLLSE